MKSLKELLKYGNELGLTDIQIISAYLAQDGMGKEAIDIVVNALEQKINQLETKYSIIRANMNFATSYYYKQYDFATADMLDTLTRTMMLDYPFSKEQIKWMKEFEVKPGPFWHDLAEAVEGIHDPSYEPNFYTTYDSWAVVKGRIHEEDEEVI